MIQIKKEFKELIPSLTADEFKQLEDNCLEEGIREKIITWKGYIIDGHNRYEIAQKWNLDYETEEKHFNNETEVKIWMAYNQLGRRNLTDFVKGELYSVIEELLKEKGRLEKSKGGGDKKSDLSIIDKSDIKDEDERHNTRKEVAEKLGWSTGKKGMFDVVKKKAPEEVKEKLRIGEVSINQAYQEIKKAEKKKKLEEKKQQYEEKITTVSDNEFKIDIFNTNERFRVIYADPAWSYNDKQDTPNLGGASKHYDTMSVKQICELPVKEISEKDSVLFLWVTSPLLEDAFKVINEWGFKYKTSFIWDKVKHNMGHYNSVRHEILLIATKGSCVPDNKTLYDSVQSIERNDNHSEKPIEFLNIIDDLYTFGNKLEMFCRKIKKDNWYGWGNEI